MANNNIFDGDGLTILHGCCLLNDDTLRADALKYLASASLAWPPTKKRGRNCGASVSQRACACRSPESGQVAILSLKLQRCQSIEG
jgi:hypothetical protein